MLDKFLNFYTKYPWVAIIILAQWFATTYIIINTNASDKTTIMGITFLSTVLYAYFGFKAPKG
ncbi:MAG: hypothetical protein HYW86_03480 [Candidatus Roizmanbacteria bacterium]|nr:MAG: hypothetical protein HYW86_03480 [Candidatus Roizmanbacteria bacterium]